MAATPTLCNFDRSKEENTDFFFNNHQNLYESLPPDYDYHICNYQEVEDGKYEAEFRIDICNEDDAKLWLEKYQQLTKVTFRVEATKPKNGLVNLFKVFYRCQHKTLPRSETANQKMSSKNTNCPAKLAMTVKRIPGELTRAKAKDLHLPDYQTVVKISHTHNHMIDSADTLKHRDVSKETVEKFKDLFSKGHSPASALNTHKLDLQLQYDQDYVYEAADRAKCPDIYFCHRLYRKGFDKAYGAASGEKMLSDLEASIAGYNNDKLASLEAAVNDCANQLIATLRCDPEELSEPVETFVKQFNSLKTNSALVGALKTFGKYTGASLDMSSSKKRKRGRRKGVAVKVQPAAVSRRKTVLGGRRCLHTE